MSKRQQREGMTKRQWRQWREECNAAHRSSRRISRWAKGLHSRWTLAAESESIFNTVDKSVKEEP